MNPRLKQSIEDVIEYTISEHEPEKIRTLAQEEQKKYARLTQQQQSSTRSDQEALNTLIRRAGMFMNAYQAAYAKTQNNQELYEHHIRQAISN